LNACYGEEDTLARLLLFDSSFPMFALIELLRCLSLLLKRIDAP